MLCFNAIFSKIDRPPLHVLSSDCFELHLINSTGTIIMHMYCR